MAEIVLLHPGEMGAAVGGCLAGVGHRVRWVTAGRSTATVERARELVGHDTLTDALAGAEVVVSVCPPHAALTVAAAVIAAGFDGTYLDANAVSPSTIGRVAAVLGSQVTLVDGGIIGAPPTAPGRSRLYLSGASAPAGAALFAGSALETAIVPGDVGAASALKMVYAAWTKGSAALIATVAAAAEAYGVGEALLAEWEQSQPALPDRVSGAARSARKAWRWSPEMEEIAATLSAVGLPAGFHLAAADVFDRMAVFKDDPEATAQEVIESLLAAAPGSR